VTDRLTGTPQERSFAMEVKKTPPGMAFTAGSGPPGKTCHVCIFWGKGEEPKYFAAGGKYSAEIKPAACAKYRQLTAGTEGPPVEHWSEACKYFDPNPNPPKLRNVPASRLY
jgi:hypothetical protein